MQRAHTFCEQVNRALSCPRLIASSSTSLVSIINRTNVFVMILGSVRLLLLQLMRYDSWNIITRPNVCPWCSVPKLNVEKRLIYLESAKYEESFALFFDGIWSFSKNFLIFLTYFRSEKYIIYKYILAKITTLTVRNNPPNGSDCLQRIEKKMRIFTICATYFETDFSCPQR